MLLFTRLICVLLWWYICNSKKARFFYLLERKKSKSAWKRNQWTRSLFPIAPVDRQNEIVQNLVGCIRRPGCDIINGIFPLIRRSISSKNREKFDIFTALLKTVYIRRNWLLICPSPATFCILKVACPRFTRLKNLWTCFHTWEPTTSCYKVDLKTEWLLREGERFSEWSLPRRISASCHAQGVM